MPYNQGTAPTSGFIVSIVGTNTAGPIYQTNSYDHIICGDYYCPYGLGGFSIVTGPSRVVLPNGFQMSGGDELTIDYGGSLTLYVDGGDSAININGIWDKSGFPSNLVVYCADGVTNLQVFASGSARAACVVVSPTSDVAIHGGGMSVPIDFSGLLMVRSLLVDTKFNFHYDEALQPYTRPPNPDHPSLAAGSPFSFQVSGTSGISYAVQASTNLVDWFPVATNVGPFSFMETNAAAADRKFYRVLWQ